MADLQPPPTYALPILVDEKSKKAQFNPIWLKWFLDLAAILDAAGGLVLEHNDLNGLQGGIVNQFFHLTQAEHAALGSSQDAIVQQRVFRSGLPRAPGVRAGTGITVSQDAQDFIVAAVATTWEIDQNILANQIFGG